MEKIEIQGYRQFIKDHTHADDETVMDILHESVVEFLEKKSFKKMQTCIKKNIFKYKQEKEGIESRRNASISDSLMSASNTAPVNTCPLFQILLEELRSDIDSALYSLSMATRKVFVLKELASSSSDDICNELNISKANYWVLIHRAKMKLKDHFARNKAQFKMTLNASSVCN